MSEESSFKVGDRVVAHGVAQEFDDNDQSCLVLFDGAKSSWWMQRNVLQHDNPIILDPDDPRAKALIGKEVEAFDTIIQLKRHFRVHKGVLSEIRPDSNFPFRTKNLSYMYIRAIPEKPVKKMTVAEVCDALGYTVEIVK